MFKITGYVGKFDMALVRDRIRKVSRNQVQYVANGVRVFARRSIKRGRGTQPTKWQVYQKKKKSKASAPGTPPKAWDKGKNPRFKLIYAIPYTSPYDYLVGMVGFRRKKVPVPGLHEKGGFAKRNVPTATTRFTKHRFINTKSGRKRVRALKRSKQIFELQYKQVKYPKRPFMVPALKAVAKQRKKQKFIF